MKRYASILVISDQHFPYAHPDILPFLKALKKKYQPDKVVNIGDELDYHASSYHESDPDLLSAGDELEAGRVAITPMFDLFPKMDLLNSNHGQMPERKGMSAGLSKQVIRPSSEILRSPRGWVWHNELILYASDKMPIYFCHGRIKDGLKLSQSMGMSVVQGHFHESFETRYWGNKLGLCWSMTVGCLIDNHSPAFAYNIKNLKRPLIGCGMIIDGQPHTIPLIMDHSGRWTGRLK